MDKVEVPKGKLADVGVEVNILAVEVGDYILFGWENTFSTVADTIVDVDVVTMVDGRGIHFSGGTYIALADYDTVLVLRSAYDAKIALAAVRVCVHRPRRADTDAGYDHCMFCVETGDDCDGGKGYCQFHGPAWDRWQEEEAFLRNERGGN